MQNIRELTVILNTDGAITAAQVRGADGVARGLALGDLPATLASVNESALLSVGELKAVRAELSAYKTQGVKAAEAVVAVVDNPDVSAEQTAARCKAIALNVMKDKIERDLDAANKVIADAIAARDKLLML